VGQESSRSERQLCALDGYMRRQHRCGYAAKVDRSMT
jgi:hypothetical protein